MANSANSGQTVATLYYLGNDHKKIKISVSSAQMQFLLNAQSEVGLIPGCEAPGSAGLTMYVAGIHLTSGDMIL